jgi:hypothetical protein
MTTPNEATEAAAPRPKATASNEANNVEILARDDKAVRILAKAEAKRIEAEARAAAQDREAARRLNDEAAQLERDAVKAARKQAKADNRAAQLAEGRRKAIAKAAGTLASIRSEAAASYAGFIYLVVVTVAVGSQFVFFKRLIDNNVSLETLQGVSGLSALLAALFIEGFGLAFYATSVAQRLRGRGGWVPRLAAWAVTGFAAKLQYEAHRDLLVLGKPLVSWACAFASLGAMLLAEVRTTYKVGETLEALDQKDRPQARLGIKFCVRYPRQAWWAFSAMIANPSIRTRTDALEAGQELARLRDWADLNEAIMREAQRALRAAQKKAGTSEAILFRLNELAHLGLDTLTAQAQLASASTAPALTEAEPAQAAQVPAADPAQVPARVVAQPRPKATEAAAQLRPRTGPVRRPTPTEAEAPVIEAKPAFDDWAAEVWAERPKGPEAWTQRIAELALVFPKELPSRAALIEAMKLRALDPDLPALRFVWTNKGYVGQASKDLAELRAEGYPDPILNTEKAEEVR